MSALNCFSPAAVLTVSRVVSSAIHSVENRPPVVLSVVLKWVLWISYLVMNEVVHIRYPDERSFIACYLKS
jgi:hypothetical protein